MSRQILFRGISIDDGDWIYGDLVTDYERYYYIKPKNNTFDKKFNGISLIEVIPETVGQFVGIVDKNRKKIFEGDILSFLDSKEKGYVVYDKNDCKFHIKVLGHGITWEYTHFGFKYGYEVIGNIHDNKELL